jgi:hypothetical protein
MADKEQEAQKKTEDAKSKVEAQKGDEEKVEIDPEVLAIMKDPAAVAHLVGQKRAANAEAKEARLKLEKLEKDRKDADDKALQEQGKHKELAEKYKAEAEGLKKTYAGQRVDFELKFEAQKAGIIDAGDAVRLCDRAGLKLSDDFAAVEGAKEAVEALKKAKPYLFGEVDGEKIPPPGIGKASLKQGTPGQPPIGSISPMERIAMGLEGKKK